MENKSVKIVLPQIGDMTAVLYSYEQGCFHLEKVHEYLVNNAKRAMAKEPFDEYRLICICNNDLEGDAFIQTFREMQNKLSKSTIDILIQKALKNE